MTRCFLLRRRPVRECTSGFTLLEILVALLILSGGLVAVLRSSNGILNALGRGRENMRAGLLLREGIDRARWAVLAEPGRRPAGAAGTFPAPFEGYSWTLDEEGDGFVALVPEAAGQLSEITISVRCLDGGVRSAQTLWFVPE